MSYDDIQLSLFNEDELIDNNECRIDDDSDSIISIIKASFDKTFDEASKMSLTEGKERVISGGLVENIVQKVIMAIRKKHHLFLECKENENGYFKRTFVDAEGNKHVDNRIGVDRNVFYKDELLAVVECKAYLDRSYLKRAMEDFYRIAAALKEEGKDPSKIRYILFVMRSGGMDDESLVIDRIDFANRMKKFGFGDISLDIYFVSNGKRDHQGSVTRSFIKEKTGVNESEAMRFERDILSAVEQFESKK